MGGDYTNSVTCINSDNLDLIEQTITSMFYEEGYLRVSKPLLPDNPLPLIKDLLSQPRLMSFSLWAIGLYAIDTPLPKGIGFLSSPQKNS